MKWKIIYTYNTDKPGKNSPTTQIYQLCPNLCGIEGNTPVGAVSPTLFPFSLCLSIYLLFSFFTVEALCLRLCLVLLKKEPVERNCLNVISLRTIPHVSLKLKKLCYFFFFYSPYGLLFSSRTMLHYEIFKFISIS